MWNARRIVEPVRNAAIHWETEHSDLQKDLLCSYLSSAMVGALDRLCTLVRSAILRSRMSARHAKYAPP